MRTWLHLTAVDVDGKIIFESGRPLADGRIEGNNSDMDILCKGMMAFRKLFM